MFFSISVCTIAPERNGGAKKIHYAAMGADVLLGVALLVIGLLATHYGFLPSNLHNGFIGAGAAYTFGILCAIGLIVKLVKIPHRCFIM